MPQYSAKHTNPADYLWRHPADLVCASLAWDKGHAQAPSVGEYLEKAAEFDELVKRSDQRTGIKKRTLMWPIRPPFGGSCGQTAH